MEFFIKNIWFGADRELDFTFEYEISAMSGIHKNSLDDR